MTYLLSQIPEGKRAEIVAELQIDLSPPRPHQTERQHSVLDYINLNKFETDVPA